MKKRATTINNNVSEDHHRSRGWRRAALGISATLAAVVVGGVVLACAWTSPAPPADPDTPRPQPTVVELTIDGQPVRVHALPTGTIGIKRCHHDLCVPESAHYLRRFASILADDEFAEPMPIWTYLVEHPQGRFVIDTGGTEDWADPDAWACDPIAGRVSRSMAQVDVRPGEALVDRLAALDLRPDDLNAAVITHLHFDHTAGIEDLGVTTYVGQGDLDAARIIGATPCRFLQGAPLVPVEPLAATTPTRAGDPGDEALGPGFSLTDDGTLRVYPTPGHTPGSLTVRLQTDQGDLWFVGDTTFDDQALDPAGPTASIHVRFTEVRALQKTLDMLKQQTGALLLPAHDDDAGERLQGFGRSAG